MEEIRWNSQVVQNLGILWLLDELDDPALVIGMHDPEARSRLSVHRYRPDGQIGLGFDVLAQDVSVIHAVELIAAEDDVIGERALEEVAQILSHSVGRSLIPMGASGCLLGSQNLYEAWREVVELEGRGDVLMQRHAIELREHVNAANPGIQAVANRDIDKAVFTTERDGRLRSLFRQREESGAGSSSHDDGQSALDGDSGRNVAHRDPHFVLLSTNCHDQWAA